MKRLFVCCLLLGVPFLAEAQSPEVIASLRSRYDVIWSFKEGLAMVNRGGRGLQIPLGVDNGKYGFVDTLGQVIVPLKYGFATDFDNGCAVVGTFDANGIMKYGVINRRGDEVIDLKWTRLGEVSDGVVLDYRRSGSGANHRCECTLVDTLGRSTLLPYNFCRDFSEGLAVAGKVTYKADTSNSFGGEDYSGHFGYITPDGKEFIPLQFADARSFCCGRAAVGIAGKYYTKWGFIDKTGAVIVPCNYYYVGDFEQGLSVVGKIVSGNLLYGYIDTSGREILPCEYVSASPFRFANTWVGKQVGERMYYMLINRQGQKVVNFMVQELDESGRFGQVRAAIEIDGQLRYGILDNQGRTILPFEYDSINIFSEWDDANLRWQEAVMATKGDETLSFDITRKE